MIGRGVFRLRGKDPSRTVLDEAEARMSAWVTQMLFKTLIGHPYASRLNPNEQSLFVSMTKSQVKPTSILLTLKENNEDNVTTTEQLYNARYTYKQSLRWCRT